MNFKTVTFKAFTCRAVIFPLKNYLRSSPSLVEIPPCKYLKQRFEI